MVNNLDQEEVTVQKNNLEKEVIKMRGDKRKKGMLLKKQHQINEKNIKRVIK